MDASSSRNTRGLRVRQLVEPGPQEVLLYAYLGMCCECSNTVDAILYACRVCPNFEWCEACAQKTEHPIDHPFLRVNLHGEGNNQAEIETEEAQQLWKLCEQASPSKAAIPFLLFVDQLSKFLKVDLTQGDVAALEAILGDISTQDEISVNSLEIKPSEFALFVKRFGPIHLSLKKIQQVLMDGSKWFHGNMDLPKATAIFKGQPNKSFLIRYSSRTPGAFSINYIKDGEMKIFNRISNNVEGEGLFVHSEKQKLQYSSFASFIKSNSHIFTYPVDDPLPSFLRIKKQKLIDMGVSAATPYTFNFSRNATTNTTGLNTSLTPEDFYDALARKADGFSNQMMATSPPGSSSRIRPKEAPSRRAKSANNTPTKPRGMSNSGNAIQGKYNKHNVDTQGIEEAPESKALRALLLESRQKSPPPHQHQQQPQQPQQQQHHHSRSGNAPASPKKKKEASMFKAGAHYTSFYSDDEEDLPDIVAGI